MGADSNLTSDVLTSFFVSPPSTNFILARASCLKLNSAELLVNFGGKGSLLGRASLENEVRLFIERLVMFIYFYAISESLRCCGLLDNEAAG